MADKCNVQVYWTMSKHIHRFEEKILQSVSVHALPVITGRYSFQAFTMLIQISIYTSVIMDIKSITAL